MVAANMREYVRSECQAAGVNEVRIYEVPGSITTLDDAIGAVERVTAELFRRLQPVLRQIPESPPESDGCCDDPCRCEISCRLEVFARRVYALTAEIDRVANRLQV